MPGKGKANPAGDPSAVDSVCAGRFTYPSKDPVRVSSFSAATGNPLREREGGPVAQRLDTAMHGEMQQDRKLWEGLGRIDTLRNELFARESLERAHIRDPKPEREQEMERSL